MAAQNKQKIILIVEDEKPMARVLHTKLQSAGFAVTICFDGAECLKIMEQGKFDLLILDLVMPKMDGFQVMQELKNKGFLMPIIILTNLAQKEDIEKAKGLGAVDYFVKSDITLVDVVNKVKQYLH